MEILLLQITCGLTNGTKPNRPPVPVFSVAPGLKLRVWTIDRSIEVATDSSRDRGLRIVLSAAWAISLIPTLSSHLPIITSNPGGGSPFCRLCGGWPCPVAHEQH